MSVAEAPPRAPTRRQVGRARTRAVILKAAATAFTEVDYDAVGMRDIARLVGMSTGAVFANFADKADLYRQAIGMPYPWRLIRHAPTDGTLCLLLVDYQGEDDGYALEDVARYGRTIGSNNDSNVGPGEGQGWQFAGWCWDHDHHVDGHGCPVGFILLDKAAPPVEAVGRA